MQAAISVQKLLIRLWHYVAPRRRMQFGLLLVLMVLASCAEIFSIGLVLPFLGVLAAPDRVFEYPLAEPFIKTLALATPEQLLWPLTALFGVAAFVTGGMRLLLLWASNRLSFSTGADLSISIYRRTLYQPYSVHVARNSSEIINGISRKTGAVVDTIVMFLTLLSSSAMLGAIVFVLLLVDPVVAIATFGGFGMIYGFIVWVTRKRLQINSQCMALGSSRVIKTVQESLGGIRDILIDGSQEAFCQIYRDSDLPVRRAQAFNTFIAAGPRYVLESLGMILFAMLAYVLIRQSDGTAMVVPVLGAFALGAQRLLPVLQQIYNSWATIQGGQASLRDALDLLDQPLPDYANQSAVEVVPFNSMITLQRISFRYSDPTPWVLRDLNFSIVKGSRTGFIGTTGSGKSTLLDIIMGLLQPTEGTLAIDGVPVVTTNPRGWQAHIAHVPQAIFLADTTIEENIAFGVPREQIDHERVRVAARQAQIAAVIESWSQQYKTIVGERGVRLSGGQRQRIGIARALYKQADVIIFDEATSSLDNETEHVVMQAIEGLSADLTILIIAHRLTTLRNCTQVIELGDGRIRRIGSYKDMITQAA